MNTSEPFEMGFVCAICGGVHVSNTFRNDGNNKQNAPPRGKDV